MRCSTTAPVKIVMLGAGGTGGHIVLAERYASVFGMEAAYVPSFVEDLDTLMKLITPRGWELEEHSCRRTMEMVLLLGAVDNNRSRQLCHEAFYQSDNLIYIDSGNGEFSGQVVCGVRAKGRTIFRPVGEVYPEMLKAADKFPTELSCAEAAQADPQSIAANITAATAVVDMIYNILATGGSTVRKVTFSTQSVNVRPELQKQSRRKKAA